MWTAHLHAMAPSASAASFSLKARPRPSPRVYQTHGYTDIRIYLVPARVPRHHVQSLVILHRWSERITRLYLTGQLSCVVLHGLVRAMQSGDIGFPRRGEAGPGAGRGRRPE